MKTSNSIIEDVRGLRYHIRSWGNEKNPKLFLLHGWMDVSASFQFVVDELQKEWHVLAPDWRGFGLSEWQKGGYYIPDYLADLEVLLNRFSPETPVTLIGHSMGGNIACVYAGVRPERVSRLISLEGFGMVSMAPEKAPERFGKWLSYVNNPPLFRPYPNYEALAQRLCENNPRLDKSKALFLAHHSGKKLDSGEIIFNSDPFHKAISPTLYRLEEAKACWRRVIAPTLWVAAIDSWIYQHHMTDPNDYAERKMCFRYLEEIVMENAGHMMHHDQPHGVATLLEDFLRRHD